MQSSELDFHKIGYFTPDDMIKVFENSDLF